MSNRVHTLCRVDEVAQGNLHRVQLSGEPAIAVANLDGRYYAFADDCTHGQGSLCDGFIDEDVVVCPIHAGEFHIPSGAAMDLPVTEDLRTYHVWVEGDRLMVDLDRSATTAAPSGSAGSE